MVMISSGSYSFPSSLFCLYSCLICLLKFSSLSLLLILQGTEKLFSKNTSTSTIAVQVICCTKVLHSHFRNVCLYIYHDNFLANGSKMYCSNISISLQLSKKPSNTYKGAYGLKNIICSYAFSSLPGKPVLIF